MESEVIKKYKREGRFNWGDSGLLDQLNDIEKEQLSDIFNKACDYMISHNIRKDIYYLPLLRRIFNSLKNNINDMNYLIKEQDIFNTDLVYLLIDPIDIINIGYEKLHLIIAGLSVLDHIDPEAEAVSFLSHDISKDIIIKLRKDYLVNLRNIKTQIILDDK